MKRKTNMVLCILLLVMSAFSAPFSADRVLAKVQRKDDVTAEVQKILDGMTVEEKVGQLFIVHVYGKTATDKDYEQTNIKNHRGGKNFQKVIEKYHVGGVIYFNWTDNITVPLNAAQVNTLSNDIQQVSIGDTGIPLFVSTDQEGGIVQRVVHPATVLPGNMAIGATGSQKLAEASGRVLGNELKRLGINTDFAPSLDVNINPDNPVIGVRSFGEDPDEVSRLGVAQIEGFNKENIISTAKHFPGHGDTATDSHYGLPVIDHDLKTLHDIDLKPFKAAINAGVDSIMTGHIIVPALDDSGLPATLSKPILTDLLRDEMNFDGLIITDSLDMAGADVVPEDRVGVEAFKAGADILLNPPNVAIAYNGVLDAVENGEISMKRLDESVTRILQKKMEDGLFENSYTPEDAIDGIGTKEHLQIASDIADQSITLVKNEDSLLPLHKDTKVLVTGPSAAKPGLLAENLDDQELKTDVYATGTSPTEAEISKAVSKADGSDVIIATTYTANTNKKQQELVKALRESGKKVVVAGMRNPYDLMAFPEVDAFLNTYSYMDISVDSLSKVITGEVNPSGKLPVAIPSQYSIGHGLDYLGEMNRVADVQNLVKSLVESDDVKANAAHKLSIHLRAVEHYENAGNKDKVIKHLRGFQQLIDQAKKDKSISDKAFSYLDTAVEKLLERLSN